MSCSYKNKRSRGSSLLKYVSEGEGILDELTHSEISWEEIKRREVTEEADFKYEMMIKTH